jgi:hypothetical protein
VSSSKRPDGLLSVGVPLDEVRRCLADPSAIATILVIQRRRLDGRIARVQRQRHTLDHLRIDGLDSPMPNTDPGLDDAEERRVAVALFNATWALLEKEDRSRDEDDAMLHMAHASRHHWGQIGAPANFARGEWQCSRVYAVLNRPEPCLHHAQRCLDICQENGIADWDVAFAYEALARAHAVGGDAAQARSCTEQALAVADDVAEDEDRELVLSDLESIPNQPRFW